MALKAVLTPGNRYGWRGALVLPEEYFEVTLSGSTGSLSVTESGFDTIASDGVVIYGNTYSTSGLSAAFTSSFTGCSGIMYVRTGGAGSLTFSGSIGYSTDGTTNGSYLAEGQWRYRTVGGSWVTGPTLTSSQAALVIGGSLDSTGILDTAATITSLSANTNYEVQLLLRRASAPAAASIDPSGTVQVTSASSTITGTLSVTESGADTFVSDGDVIVKGSLAVTESGSDTFVSTGDVIVQGSLSVSETGSDTVTSTGTVLAQGALSVTENGADSFVSSGTTGFVDITGSMSVAEAGSDTLASIGTILVKGPLAVTEGNADAVVSNGKVTVQGSLSASETGADTIASTGTVLVKGTLSVTEGTTDTIVSSGNVEVKGSLSVTEGTADTFTASGTIPRIGSLVVTESGPDTFVSTGKVTVQGTLAVSESGSDTFIASGVVVVGPITGTMAVTESSTDTFNAYFVTELDTVRGFDGIRRRKGVVKSRYVSIEAPEHAMFSRLLEYIEFKPTIFYSPSDPFTKRIGYGRPIVGSEAEELLNLRNIPEMEWRDQALQAIIDELEIAHPEYNLPLKMSKALYEYQVRYGA